jgi:hypothetical protein
LNFNCGFPQPPIREPDRALIDGALRALPNALQVGDAGELKDRDSLVTPEVAVHAGRDLWQGICMPRKPLSK